MAFFSLVFFSCGGDGVYTIKTGVSTVPTEPPSIALKRFAELVGERSNNRIKVQVYEGGVLGMDRDLIEGVLLGTVQMHMAANSPLATFVPELMIFEMPFLFENNEHFHAVMDSPLAWDYAAALEERGFHLLGFMSHGVRHILTNERPIHSMEDMKGLKIRTMENPAHLDVFSAFGASPLPMSYSELYTALETGVIDGAEAANSNYWGNRIYEVGPNWAQIGWLHLVAPLIVSKSFYDNLPPDLQKVLDDTGREIAAYERELYAERDKELLSRLEEAGVNITYPDRESFVEAAQPVYDKWAEDVGGMEKIRAIMNFEY
jgi:tripartite ATP-independent transporter DctP family solute receptor